MSMIPEKTAADPGQTGSQGFASCGRQSRRRPSLHGADMCDRGSVRRGRGTRPLRAASGQVVPNSRGREILETPKNTRNSNSLSTGAPALDPQSSTLQGVALYDQARTVCRLGPVEQVTYGILAASAVLTAGGGLYWVAKLINHWSLFGAGIEKLLQ